MSKKLNFAELCIEFNKICKKNDTNIDSFAKDYKKAFWIRTKLFEIHYCKNNFLHIWLYGKLFVKL